MKRMAQIEPGAPVDAPHSTLAWVALGSNLGDSARLVAAAMDRLQDFSDSPLLRSSLWTTNPVDCPPGSPPFVNAAVGMAPRAEESPETLLAKLQAIEQEFGRQPKKLLNEPRPLDLDLIAFGAQTRSTSVLTLPHPRAHQRRFVLQPLSKIAPGLILPGQTQAVIGLLAEMSTDYKMARL